MTEPSPKEASVNTIQTKRLRAEFSVQAGSRKFNPVTAATSLFTTLIENYPSINLTNVDGTSSYTKTDDLPSDIDTFEKHFQVSPHLGRSGGGKVHLHFRISTEITIAQLKQKTTIIQHLQRNRIWLTPHQFTDINIGTVGYVFMKYPSMTHLTDYVHSLKMYLLQKVATYCTPYPHEEQPTENPSDDQYNRHDMNIDKLADKWKLLQDLPHMEIMRRTLTINPPNGQSNDNPISTQVLELKCNFSQVHLLREVLLQAQLPLRQFGIFIPPTFLKEEGKASYNTALRHVQFLFFFNILY